MRLLLQCAALCCAFIALAAQARPFTVDDLLKVDRRSSVGVSPDGRWLVLSITRGQAFAPRFDYDAVYPFATRRLYRVDLRHPGPATPLLSQEDSAGYTAGSFSPDGRRVLVNRLRAHDWETGVVDIETGRTRWLGVGMDFPLFGRAAQWRSDHEIVAIVTPPDRPHALLRRGWQRGPFIDGARQATAEGGGPSVLSVGSGRYLDRGAAGPMKSLARINVDTGVSTSLAVGEFLDLELSSSGRYVAAFKAGQDIQPHGEEVIKGGTVARRREVVIADLDANALLPGCDDCFASPFLLSWAPTSDRLLIYAHHTDQPGSQSVLHVLAPSGDRLQIETLGQARPALSSTFEGFEIVQAGWIGLSPVVLGRRTRDTDAGPPLWLRLGTSTPTPLLPGRSQPDKLIANAKGQYIALGDGKAVRVRNGRITALGAASAAPSSILGETGRPTMAHLTQGDDVLLKRRGRLVSIDAFSERDLGPLDDQAILAAGTGVSVLATRDAHGVETIRVRTNDTDVTVLTLNPQLADVEFGQVRPVTHKGPDGESLTSWVVLPPDWRAGAPPPLVVLPYPGTVLSSATPPADARPGGALTNVSSQVLAGQGYAVLFPSLPRGSYPDAPAENLAAQILSVVDAVGATGLADSKRVALWGHSFGGHAVLAAATQSDRFKAIVATSGISDLVSAWGSNVVQSTPDEGLFFLPVQSYVETGQMRVGGPPWATPDRYVRNSPVFQADKITAPVLLAYGDLDAYSDGQGGEMFAALYRQGKDARLLTFWGEGHVVTAPGNVRRLYAEVLSWLDQSIGVGAQLQASKATAP